MQKGSIRTPIYGVQPTSTYLITKKKQVGSTTYTNSCNGTKPTHTKGQVTLDI
jgi:hypothetical protein